MRLPKIRWNRWLLAFCCCCCAVSSAFTEEVTRQLRILDATPAGDQAIRQVVLATGMTDPELTITLRKSSAAAALTAIREGKADLALLEETPLPLQFPGVSRVYAAAAAVLYVNAVNGVEGLSEGQVRELYLSPAPTWEPYNQQPAQVHFFDLLPDAPGAGLFQRRALKGAAAAVSAAKLSSTAELILLTGADPVALGAGLYVPSAPIRVKLLKIGGVAPTPETIFSGRYPYAVRYSIVSGKQPSAEAERFLKQLTTPEFRDQLYEAGLIPPPTER